MILTEQDRLAAKQAGELERAHGKMSETAKAKLRAVNEADKARIAANAALIKEFKQLSKDCSTMKQFLLRLGLTDNLERRAIKLRYALSHGWVPTADLGVTGFLFLSELSNLERKMSEEKFLSSLASTWGTRITELGHEEPRPVRRCARGSKCFKALKRQPAEVTGSGKFCSSTCKGAHLAGLRRARVSDMPVLTQ